MTASDASFQIRPVRESEHQALGEVTVQAYLEGGFLHGAKDSYAAELRKVAERTLTATVLVAMDGEQLIGGVTYAPPGSASSQWGSNPVGFDPVGICASEIYSRSPMKRRYSEKTWLTSVSVIP
ncbi:hypothetical protein [Glycomyces buryatensis]|uniref:GNAT family N-acetyltransferase n=1 Tax=Glycomyces buryatensis TaxID=2570927 RepID=A0A4S8Q1P8_9ACTN|nr:hypothetical protein [Glycomyces buryatensis]THV37021.1 hypothetical protein FAB82_20925 [Glycomyces buryatensis]